MTTTTDSTLEVHKPPLWRNVRVLAWVFQLAVLAAVAAVVAILVNNVRVNSANIGIPVDFGFLDQPAGFTIPANDFRQTQSVQDAVVEGVLNTLRVVVVGLVLSSVLGTLIGIGRLSGNWLLNTLCRLYVELIRNVPLLGLLMFAYLALVLTVLPAMDDAITVGRVLVIGNRGVAVPYLTGPRAGFVLLFLAALVAAWLVTRWRRRVADRTGAPARDLVWSLATVVVVTVVGALVLGNGITGPALDGRRIDGGIVLQPEYFALLLALVVYTASHIAEIVRGSIQAVPKGQFEAASALALGSWSRMRYVILPQAFRIAVPPIGNQYLNLAKNSSLGFAVSYFELTKTMATSIGNRSPAVPAYTLLIAIYLVLSLLISLVVNWANRRLQVVGR
jgi:general L-amino acid transport system permease protein